MIASKNVATVTRALVEQLQENVALAALNPRVERSGKNDDPNLCPWIGVYRFGVQFPVLTLGMGTGFRNQEIRLALAIQQSDGTSGEECEDRLEELLAAVVGAILSDTTLKGTVMAIGEDFDIQYPDYQLKNGMYMQTAVLQFTALTRVSAT